MSRGGSGAQGDPEAVARTVAQAVFDRDYEKLRRHACTRLRDRHGPSAERWSTELAKSLGGIPELALDFSLATVEHDPKASFYPGTRVYEVRFAGAGLVAVILTRDETKSWVYCEMAYIPPSFAAVKPIVGDEHTCLSPG